MLKIITASLLMFVVLLVDVSAETITHNGITYGTVTSPYTGRVWLDRNLGASQVCTAIDDVDCYGDYYQWGRGTDGHEKYNSATTDIQATDINNAGSNLFIIDTSYPYDWLNTDDNKSARIRNWMKDDGSSICPSGYMVPTIEEIKNETINLSIPITNNIDAYNSFLRLPSAEARNSTDGSIGSKYTDGFLSSSNFTDDLECRSILLRYIGGIVHDDILDKDYSTDGAYTVIKQCGYAHAVRCIKVEVSNELPTANAGPDQVVTIGTTVTLTSSSTDSDGTIVSNEWKEGTTVLGTTPTFIMSDFSIGTHTITLTVTDDDGASASDEVIITVTEIPRETLSSGSLNTKILNSANQKAYYEFILSEKSLVSINFSSDTSFNSAGWISDQNGTKVSTLGNWNAGPDSQFKFEQILNAGTYKFDVFKEDVTDVSYNDFSFTYTATPEAEIVKDAWTINIPANYSYSKNEYFSFYIDAIANNGIATDSLVLSSTNLPLGVTLNGRTISGSIDSSESFEVTISAIDTLNNFSKEYKINFQIDEFDVYGIIGDGSGSKMVIKQDANGTIKPFQVAFNIKAFAEEDITSVECKFRDEPILSKEVFTKTYYRENAEVFGKYICNMDDRAFTRGASSSEDFMQQLVAIDDAERFLTVVVNLKDGTSVEKKILEPIPIEQIGGFIRIREWQERTTSFSGGAGTIGVEKQDGSYLYYEYQDIVGKEFLVDYGDEVHLSGGRWTVEVDNHELFVNLDNSPCGVAFVANENTINEEILLNISYMTYGEKLELYGQKLNSDNEGVFKILKIASEVARIWTKSVHLADECTNGEFIPNNGPSVGAIRGTTFSMILAREGIDYNLYEGMIDIIDTNNTVVATLNNMESYTNKDASKKEIAKIDIPAIVKTYLDETSTYQAELNATLSQLDIVTNLSNASFVLLGDNVRVGDGNFSSLSEISEGNYTLRFLPIEGFDAPADINFTFNKDNIFDTISAIYRLAQHSLIIDGVDGAPSTTEDGNTTLDRNGAHIELFRDADGKVSHFLDANGIRSWVYINIANANLRIDELGRILTSFTLPKDMSIEVLEDGRVRPILSGALLPKDDLPAGTKVEVNNDKIKFTVPMADKIEF